VQWYYGRDRALKDFAVLSPGPGEGKTTVASNIAIALSQIQLNVLLVDSDIRKGRLHASYDLPNDRGLGHYLTVEKMPLDQVIQKTTIPELSLVSRGDSIINSSQLFSCQKMSDFIKETRERFDIVIYDTPPLMIISDAGILIPKLMGSLLVVRSGVTSFKVLPKVFSMIQKSESKFIGVALNSTDFTQNSYYSKYYQRS